MRSRARQPTTTRRIAIMFPPDAVYGIVAMCIEMSGAPKFEYHPSGSIVYFTPSEFRLYMENLRAVMRDRDLDQQDKIEAREAYSSAMEQYYRQEQAGGVSIGARNPLSDLSGLDIALIATGVGVLGYIAYRIYQANYSPTAQGAEAWAVSGGSSPTGMGQFVNQQPGYVGPAVGTTNYQDFPQGAYIDTMPGSATPTDETPNFCVSGTPGAPFCWVDQGNTDASVAQGDIVAVMAQPATGGDPIPVYGHIYGSTNASGNIVAVDDSNNVRVYFGNDPSKEMHTFPLSYLVAGLDLVGAAVGA